MAWNELCSWDKTIIVLLVWSRVAVLYIDRGIVCTKFQIISYTNDMILVRNNSIVEWAHKVYDENSFL